MAVDAPQPEPAVDPPASRLKRLIDAVRPALAAARKRPLMSLLIGGTVGLVVLVVSFVSAFLTSRIAAENAITPEAALAWLDRGELARARSVAAQLYRRRSDSKQLAVAGFVLGAVTARRAEQQRDPLTQSQLYRLAARYLLESHQRGFPPGREAEGSYLLGISLYRAGLRERSIPHLQRALVALPKHRAELHRLLAGALADEQVRQDELALQHVRQYLAHPETEPEERDQARLLESRLLFRLGRLAESRQSLQQIAPQSPVFGQAMVLEAQIRMSEAARQLDGQPPAERARLAAEAYQPAKQLLSELVARRADVLPIATYLLAVCCEEAGQTDEAITHYEAVRRFFLDEAVGLPSLLREADLMRQLGRGADAVALYEQALAMAAEPDRRNNPWMPVAQMRQRAEQAYAAYVQAGSFAEAVRLAQAATGLFRPAESLLWQADAERQWAQQLQQPSGAATQPDASVNAQAEARRHYRQAGRLYRQLAQLRFATREYPNDLWQAADALLKGHDYRTAAEVLRLFLQHAPRSHVPQARVALGEALLALGQIDEALQTLMACVEQTPDDPASYRARLIAAHACWEKDDWDQAQSLLEDNLFKGQLTPDSVEWRDSLFLLGKLLHERGIRRWLEADAAAADATSQPLEAAHRDFRAAIRRLKEFVLRYGDGWQQAERAAQLAEASYLLAESYRRAAEWPKHRLQNATIETVRSSLVRQFHGDLTAAAEQYQQLEAKLRQREDQGQLSPVEQSILRNCYFARADTLYELGRYEEAIREYSSATNRYHDRPEALEAFVQIANCYRRLNRPAEARGTIQQAKVVLHRIPPDADFRTTTRYDRDQWASLLDWLASL